MRRVRVSHSISNTFPSSAVVDFTIFCITSFLFGRDFFSTVVESSHVFDSSTIGATFSSLDLDSVGVDFIVFCVVSSFFGRGVFSTATGASHFFGFSTIEAAPFSLDSGTVVVGFIVF